MHQTADLLEIQDDAELTALVGEPIQRVKDKVRTSLHELDRAVAGRLTVLPGRHQRRRGPLRRVAQGRPGRAVWRT